MPADPCLMLETKSFGQRKLSKSNLSLCWLPSGCKILWSKNWTIAICRSADCPVDATSFGQKKLNKSILWLCCLPSVCVQSHIPHCGGRGGHSFWLERFKKEAETQELTVKTALGLYDSALFSQNCVRSLASLCVNGNASGSLPYAGDEIFRSKKTEQKQSVALLIAQWMQNPLVKKLNNSNLSLCWLPSGCYILWPKKTEQKHSVALLLAQCVCSVPHPTLWWARGAQLLTWEV